MNRRTFTQLATAFPAWLAFRHRKTVQAEATPTVTAPADVALFTHEDGPHLSSYIDALAKTPEVGSVLLCDPKSSTVESVRAGVGAKFVAAYQSPQELFQARKPLVSLIAMEAVLAPPVIHAALDAGCHIMAEKPACVRPADFAPLVAKAHASKRLLMLALTNRLEPAMLEARRIIQSGEIGKVFGIELHFIADQTRVKSAGYQKSWMSQKARAGGGHLTWLGIHWLDLAMYLTGSRITHVAGFSGNVGGQPIDTEDSAAISLRFANGTFGTLTSGYYLDRGKHLFAKVWGSGGWLELNPGTANPLEWYSTKSGKPESHRFKPTTPSVGSTGFLGHVVRAALGKESPVLTPDESLYVLQTISAAYKAAETGHTQPVALR
jgi:predicted dehydrogenase